MTAPKLSRNMIARSKKFASLSKIKTAAQKIEEASANTHKVAGADHLRSVLKTNPGGEAYD